MGYRGWEPDGGAVERVPSTISAADMYARYISQRRPVVLEGALDDDAWRGARWTDLSYLTERAGDTEVQVEPVHPTERCFGTSVPRQTMRLSDFLDKVQSPSGAGELYLTTQYDDAVDESALPALRDMFPAPMHALRDDLPRHPRVLGGLVLQQCNLWIGSGSARSSGLHHDFHDNLYVVLSGSKRFVLFPPSAHAHLHVRGDASQVHPNGLIVYEDAERVREDGLDVLDAARWRVEALEQMRGAKRRKDGAASAYEAAQQALRDVEARYGDDGDSDGNDGDDDQGKEEEKEEEEDDDDDDDDGDDDDDDDDDEDEGGILDDASEAGSEWAAPVEDGEDLLRALDAAPSEPPSFSRIQPHVLHRHLGLAPEIPEPQRAATTTPLTPAPGCPPALVVDLRPGEMLYLPASWFHEVTSRASETLAPHMALNYWMYPPDDREGDAAHPYRDRELWAYLRQHVESI